MSTSPACQIIIPTEDERFLTITYPKVRPNYYEISNYGTIKRIKDGKILKPDTDRDGYRKIELVTTDTKKPCKCFVHRLVAWEFIGPPPSDTKTLINHKNTYRDYNYYENLEWCTPKENTHHGEVFGNIKHGPQFGNRKYSTGLIEEYIRYILLGWSNVQILDYYNLSGKIRKNTGELLSDIRNKKSHRFEFERIENEMRSTTIQLPR